MATACGALTIAFTEGVRLDDKGSALVVGIYRFTLDLVSPALESVRAEDDRIPKPDAFVIKLDR